MTPDVPHQRAREGGLGRGPGGAARPPGGPPRVVPEKTGAVGAATRDPTGHEKRREGSRDSARLSGSANALHGAYHKVMSDRRNPLREPGVWSVPDRFPCPSDPGFEERLVRGDLAAICYDPLNERVVVLADRERLRRYRDLRTPFFGHVRAIIRRTGVKDELGRAKATEIEGRARAYPYYLEKARFKATSRLQLAQPIPVKDRPGEFWWPPREPARRLPAVTGGTPEERQEIYDDEAERAAKQLILLGQFPELLPYVDPEAWLDGEGL